MNDIAFLHTSPVHVPTFDRLLTEQAPDLKATHLVREDLLAQAQRDGVGDAALVAGVQRALESASAEARVVVCTCSTLGGLAEPALLPGGVPVTRIDRAMADDAVRRGAPVLTVAAVQSTLAPTEALLRSSAERLALPLVLRALWVQHAWQHFEAGRQAAYIASIVDAVRRDAHAGETIVLAQASMAAAAGPLSEAGFTVLTSPRLGVEHAVRLFHEASGRRA